MKLLIEKGALNNAAELCREAGDWETLAQLICNNAPDLLEQSRFETLLKWLAYLPEPVVQSSAWLQFWVGTALTPSRPDKSAEHLRQAYKLFEESGEMLGVTLSATGLF